MICDESSFWSEDADSYALVPWAENDKMSGIDRVFLDEYPFLGIQ